MKVDTVHRLVAGCVQDTVEIVRWYPKLSIVGLPLHPELKNFGNVMWLKHNPITIEQMGTLKQMFQTLALQACRKGLRYETRKYANRANLFDMLIKNQVTLGLS